MSPNTAVRRLIRSRPFRDAATSSGAVADFARGYVAGFTVSELVPVAEKLRGQGLLLSLAYQTAPGHEAATFDQLVQALTALGDGAAGTELSVRPSALAPGSDAARASRLTELCAVARGVGAVVTLEMERSEDYERTLRLWEGVRGDETTLGLTLPVDVRRAESDAQALAATGARLRLCVGSYPVPRRRGYQSEQDKLLALVRCLRAVMEGGGYAMLASHEPTIIAITQELGRRSGLAPDAFEFQMYYGVRPLEQRRLVDIGYRSRAYLPFGPGWFDYLTHRVAARPRTIYSFLRAMQDKR